MYIIYIYSSYTYVLIHENILYIQAYIYVYVYIYVCEGMCAAAGGEGFKRRDAFWGGDGSLWVLHEPRMHISKRRTRWHDRLSYDFCHAIAIAGVRAPYANANTDVHTGEHAHTHTLARTHTHKLS
jgi:hypothetical protein